MEKGNQLPSNPILWLPIRNASIGYSKLPIDVDLPNHHLFRLFKFQRLRAMDQLKQQLAGVIKYGFWILCGVTVVGSLGVAFWSASNLTADRNTQIDKLKADKAAMTTIQGAMATHPNDKTKSEMETLISALKLDVADSWTKQYARQKALLIWPVNELKQDFVDAFKNFEPIELTVNYPVEKEVEVGLLRRYRDYIGQVLPEIAEVGGTEWTADFSAPSTGSGGYGSGPGGMGGMPGMGGGMPGMGGGGLGGGGLGGLGGGESGGSGYPGGLGGLGGLGGNTGLALKDPPLVKWSTASQTALISNLFPWRGKDPGTLDVLYSQENLWVLRQLMEVIANVNGDAKQPFQATIREINEIAIGKAASRLAGTGGGDGMGTVGSGMPGTSASGFDPGASSGGGGEGGGAAAEAESPDPADMRYVDINYEPIDAATLRSSMSSASPESAYLTVAKRIPVRMNLKIDQRKIPLLVAECGNAAMMIEVRQVRVNPRATTGYGGGGGMGGGGLLGGSGGMPGGGLSGGGMTGGGLSGGGMSGGGMSGGGMSGGDESGGGGMTGGANRAGGEFPNDVTVEVSGIVYIYNPPDMEKLGIEKVNEDTLVEGDTENLAGEAVAPPVVATVEEVDTDSVATDDAGNAVDATDNGSTAGDTNPANTNDAGPTDTPTATPPTTDDTTNSGAPAAAPTPSSGPGAAPGGAVENGNGGGTTPPIDSP